MRKIINGFLFLSVFLFLGSQNLVTADNRDFLTLEQCLLAGIADHPLLHIARSNVENEKARLRQVEAAFDARVDFRANWKRQQVEFLRNRPVNKPTTYSTSETLGVSKTLSDSGQNQMQRKAAGESLKAFRARYESAVIDVAANIKSAYFKAQQAMALLRVRLETLQKYERHLEKVKGFVEVGTRPPYDITRAQVDVANARVDLITARSQVKVTLANLARAMGINGNVSIAEYSSGVLPEKITEEKSELLDIALARPEVKTAEYQRKSAEYRVEEAKRSLRPYLSASGDYSWSGTSAPLDRQWGVGVSLSWQVFDGRLNRAKIAAARSQSANAGASLDNLSLSVRAEVENAVTSLSDAIERYHATSYVVQQAQESMDFAEGRYDAGLGSPIEIADARAELARAQGNHVLSYFDSLIAGADLDRVLGRLPPELNSSETGLND